MKQATGLQYRMKNEPTRLLLRRLDPAIKNLKFFFRTIFKNIAKPKFKPKITGLNAFFSATVHLS